ncbi:MAG: restriction endonuclease subunit S [Lachnospiraceae bacterium]|nr:restriction endonuclease subunit S [Lachnospiraceae bacterium]
MDTRILREKILDLAIRGKLVPQDPNDEPASALLERIRAEKQQMVKEGKLKAKDVKDDTVIFVGEDNLHYEKFQDGTVKCIEDEIPFEVPEGWEWCRLQTICSALTDGTHRTPIYSDEGYIFLSSKNVTKGVIDWDNIMYIPENLHNELYARLAPRLNDILLAKNGTIGVAALVDRECLFDIYVSLALIRIVKEIILPQYILSVIGSSYIQDYFNRSLKGIGVPNLHLEHIKSTLIPIPSYQEQLQIVEKINEIIPLINQIQHDRDNITQVIAIIKSKVLDLAIRGKLVPQDPKDEPVSILLERIRTKKEEMIKQGKIKRDKKESIIFKGDDNSYYEKIGEKVHCIDGEIPFEIPDNWAWCRLGVLFQHNTGKALNSSDSDGILFPYITTSNVYWGRFELENLKKMLFTQDEIDKCTIKKGDLLVCEGGDIGRSAIWDSNSSVMIQNHIHRLRPYCNLNIKLYYYIFWLYKTRGFIEGNGIGLQGLSSNKLHSLLVPLLPLAEQNKIVNRINRLFAIIISVEEAVAL